MRAIVVTVLALLVGCGGSKVESTDSSSGPAPTTAASTTTTSATTSTVAPTTTVGARGVARAAYETMENEWNAATELVYNSYVSSEGSFEGVAWEDQPTWCGEQAVVDEKLAADITGYAWPTEFQAKADELSLALTVRAGLFRDCSQLPGSYIGQTPVFDRTDDAYEGLYLARNRMRYALGMPAA